MKTTTSPKGYLLVTHGSASAKIYSRERKKDGATYLENALVYYDGATRVRRYFADLKDAKDEAERVLIAMANGATKALTLTNADAEAYSLAVEELKAVGATLLPATREYRSCVELLRGKASLVEAVRYFVSSGAAELVPKSVPDAVSEFLTAKEKRSSGHYADLKYRLGKFAGQFKGPIADVKRSQIIDWLDKLGAAQRSRANFARAITSFFRWARDDRDYLPKLKPTEAERLVKKDDLKGGGEDVVILKPAEVRVILDRIASARPELLPFVAISAFAGLRTAEIERLDWSQVDFEQAHIEIKKSQAKTRTRRLVPILPNLAKWLAPYRGTQGKVSPYSRSQYLIQKEIERPGEQGTVTLDWKRNALRHSFGTYRLAAIKDENQVALEMGNSPAMLFANYRGLSTDAQAKEYWAIEPKA